MKHAFLFLTGLLLLSSCGPSPLTLAQQNFAVMDRSCAAKYPDQPPTMAAYQKCRNAAAETLDAFYPSNSDIVALLHAKRVEIADQADEGQITLDQANAQIAETVVQANQEMQNRKNQNSEAAAMNMSAAANMMTALHASQPQPQSLQPLPQNYVLPLQPVITTNCSGFGNQVSCVSH